MSLHFMRSLAHVLSGFPSTTTSRKNTPLLITICPKNSRARNRQKEHGPIFRLIKEDLTHFLVESLNPTWCGVQWTGWFKKETEATFEEFKEKVAA